NTDAPMRAIRFFDENTGVVVSLGGIIFKTTDGGLNWTSKETPTYYVGLAASFTSLEEGTVVGSWGSILKREAGTPGGGENAQLFFDGVDDVCYIPGGETLFSEADTFTVEFWLKPQGGSFIHFPITSSTINVYFAYNSDGAVVFNTAVFGGGIDVGTVDGALPFDGNWHHIACVRTGPNANGGKVYVDGVDRTDPTHNTPGAAASLTGDLVFGGVPGGGFFYNGALDDIRVWNVERTEQQINENKDVQLNGNEQGLIGYWKF